MTRPILARAVPVLALAGALVLGAPETSQAGRGGVFNHGNGGNGLKVRVGRPHGGAFTPAGPGFRKHGFRKHKKFRRGVFVPAFGVFSNTTYRTQPAPTRPAQGTVATPPAPPPTPGVKWIHVGPTGDDTLLSGTALGQGNALTQGEPPTDCLSVQTEILLEDQPVKAFGTACRQADGTWRLRPADQTTN